MKININDDFIPRQDEYIGEDGELHCKHCNGARSLTYLNKRMRCICECEEHERAKREDERKKNERCEAIKQLQSASLIGEEYKGVTFENTETGRSESFNKAYALCKTYCEQAEWFRQRGQGVYLYGALGCGKTHLAACMANSLIKQCKPVLFTNFFKIMQLIRNEKTKNGKESDILDKLAVVEYLFIDDIGAERVSANGEETWVQEYIFNILNDRLSNRMPTIFTSNYGLKELRDKRGLQPRICDRIARIVGTAAVKIEAPNYRREQVKNESQIFC